MTRGEILARYRDLRAIGTRHHSAALDFVSRQAILEHAKRLGLADGRMLVAESEEEMTLVFDLALYAAKQTRSRALDRYVRAVRLPPDSDEARMLDAPCPLLGLARRAPSRDGRAGHQRCAT